MQCTQKDRLQHPLRHMIVALGIVMVTASVWSDDRAQNAAEPTLEYFPPPSEAERRYEAALEKPVTATFHETPIPEALQTLSELVNVPIRLEPALQSELDAEAALSGEFEAVPLSAILGRIRFGSGDLEMAATPAWYPAGDGITVTIRALWNATHMPDMTRIYPVGDLCASQPERERLIDVLKSGTRSLWKATNDDGVSGVLINGVLYTSESDDFAATMVQAGSISYLDAVDGLIVQAAPSTHFDVLQLLRMIRQARQAMASPPQPVPTVQSNAAPGESDPAAETVFTFTVPFTR